MLCLLYFIITCSQKFEQYYVDHICLHEQYLQVRENKNTECAFCFAHLINKSFLFTSPLCLPHFSNVDFNLLMCDSVAGWEKENNIMFKIRNLVTCWYYCVTSLETLFAKFLLITSEPHRMQAVKLMCFWKGTNHSIKEMS